MKLLKVFFLTSMALVVSCASLHAMEPFMEQHLLLRLSISDIQNDAKDLIQDTGVMYQIVTQPILVEKCLHVLGLDNSNTLLDVRYHYELMKKKLLNNDGLLNVATKAYNQLMLMFSQVEQYEKEIRYLLGMSFKQLQAMELEDKNKSTHKSFLRRKNMVINAAIMSLEKQRQQYLASHQVSDQFGLPRMLQIVFNLPADVPADVVDEHYKSYMRNYQNYRNTFVGQGNISMKQLRDKSTEVENVQKSYRRYVQTRGLRG